MDKEIKELNKKAQAYSETLQKVHDEVKKVIVGQDDMIKKTLLALSAEGHVLLEGVPGLAKTLMVRTLSQCIKTTYVRLQFTPDLLPADITGTKIYNHSKMAFSVSKGPIFANIILADEINRAPPKVQSALLEAMQEKQVSIQGETFPLENPFLVLATQNPIESEGTYKLPEAQVDRFMMKILIDYPGRAEEKEIITRFTEGKMPSCQAVLDAKMIEDIQKFTRQVYCDEKIKDYVSEIVDATRNPQLYKLDIDGYVEYGASPRASICLILAAKANAVFNGRGYLIPEDIKAVSHEVLRHRIILTYEAEAEGITQDKIIGIVLGRIKVP